MSLAGIVRRCLPVVSAVVCVHAAAAQNVSASQHHVCALGAAGDLHCWGTVPWLWGSEVPIDSSGFIPQAPGAQISQFGTGWLFDCALTASGEVFCAGGNDNNELGRGLNDACPGVRCGRPTPVETKERFTSLAVGWMHSCALNAAGAAFCWGGNEYRQTGVSPRVRSVDRPSAVIGGYRFKQLTAGTRHNCGLTLTNVTLCWGSNSAGQLGVNPIPQACATAEQCTAIPTPVDDARTYVTLRAGGDKTCGITAAGKLYCWGGPYSSAVGQSHIKAIQIGAGSGFTALTMGDKFTCGIVRDGRAFCWRENHFGAIGRDLITWGCRGTDVCVDETPMGGALRFVSIAASQSLVCAIATTGALYCWGSRDFAHAGQGLGTTPDCALGRRDETNACSSEPFRVGGELRLVGAKK